MSFKIQSSKKNPTTFRKSPMDGSWSPTMTDAIRSFLSKVGKNGVEEVFDVALIEEAPALKAAAKESGVRGRSVQGTIIGDPQFLDRNIGTGFAGGHIEVMETAQKMGIPIIHC